MREYGDVVMYVAFRGVLSVISPQGRGRDENKPGPVYLLGLFSTRSL